MALGPATGLPSLNEHLVCEPLRLRGEIGHTDRREIVAKVVRLAPAEMSGRL